MRGGPPSSPSAAQPTASVGEHSGKLWTLARVELYDISFNFDVVVIEKIVAK